MVELQQNDQVVTVAFHGEEELQENITLAHLSKKSPLIMVFSLFSLSIFPQKVSQNMSNFSFCFLLICMFWYSEGFDGSFIYFYYL